MLEQLYNRYKLQQPAEIPASRNFITSRLHSRFCMKKKNHSHKDIIHYSHITHLGVVTGWL